MIYHILVDGKFLKGFEPTKLKLTEHLHEASEYGENLHDVLEFVDLVFPEYKVRILKILSGIPSAESVKRHYHKKKKQGEGR